MSKNQLQDINTVGWTADAMQKHVFDCHDRIVELEAERDAAREREAAMMTDSLLKADEIKRLKAIVAKLPETADGVPVVVEDGFGGVWKKCDKADCNLHVVRPGKVQCDCEQDSPAGDWCPGCGGPTDHDDDFYCDKCIMATGSMGPPVKRNFDELRDKKAHKSKQVCSELSMNDKAHQLATLLDAILYQADLLEQVQAMYGEDSIEAASRLDLLTGVTQGAKTTVDRHNLTPNGIYSQGASND